jgi:ribosomal protein S18 acetylase RimI-like enzyme
MRYPVMTTTNTTTQIVKIASSAAEEEPRVMDALRLAFVADPATRWVWPDPQKYLENFPKFAKAFGGRAFEHKSAYYIDGYAAAALWLPPNVHPDVETLGSLLQDTGSNQAQRDALQVFEQMGSYHPSEPHWYLPLLGVDPLHHGKGLGSTLMKHVLGRCDSENKVAYLESSNPRNIPFYERLGFKVLGTIQLGSSPKISPMLRKPGK